MRIHHVRFCMYALVLAGLIVCTPARALCATEAPSLEAKEVSAKEAAILINKPSAEALVIIDVRTAQEFAEGHIANAKNMDFFGPHLERQLLQLNRQSPTLVYCNSGNRSGGVLDILEQIGFTKVYHLTQGLVEWRAAGLPVVQGKK